MKTFGLLRWIVLGGILVTPMAYAQLEQRMNVKVPFDFHVRDKKFPAGEYTVKAGTSAIPMFIQSMDMRQAGFVLTQTVTARTWRAQPSLIFNRYAEDYFLSTVWLAGSNAGRSLPQSREETEMARRFPAPGGKVVVGTLGPSKR